MSEACVQLPACLRCCAECSRGATLPVTGTANPQRACASPARALHGPSKAWIVNYVHVWLNHVNCPCSHISCSGPGAATGAEEKPAAACNHASTAPACCTEASMMHIFAIGPPSSQTRTTTTHAQGAVQMQRSPRTNTHAWTHSCSMFVNPATPLVTNPFCATVAAGVEESTCNAWGGRAVLGREVCSLHRESYLLRRGAAYINSTHAFRRVKRTRSQSRSAAQLLQPKRIRLRSAGGTIST